MLFCDACDLGYHMSCHRPPVKVKPQGTWACFKCNPKAKKKRDSSASSSSSTRMLPLLPPHLHPHTGQLPENWEEYPVDGSIPEVCDWRPLQVSDYLVSRGISPDHANVFINEEIDGKSLLLLQRQDVLSALGLKFGPALKVFKQVKRLQTRRNFP